METEEALHPREQRLCSSLLPHDEHVSQYTEAKRQGTDTYILSGKEPALSAVQAVKVPFRAPDGFHRAL